MTTFFMFGKYTPESVRQVSIERTQQAVAAIEGTGWRSHRHARAAR